MAADVGLGCSGRLWCAGAVAAGAVPSLVAAASGAQGLWWVWEWASCQTPRTRGSRCHCPSGTPSSTCWVAACWGRWWSVSAE